MQVSRAAAAAFTAGTAVVSAIVVTGILWCTGALAEADSSAAIASQPRTETRTVTVTATAPQPTAEPDTSTVTTTSTNPYPKLVDADSVDSRLTAYSELESLVQLAPGVYAEPPASGELDDYSSYLGLCVDVKRYAEVHPGGYTCW